ncbi:DMT family transporter [Marinobacter sp. JSM 1782161]|uniref:DMT family transporter n=1 Tax=Marinobacter sp. JSM 1782161 TaxID=2685906 RepID=UPI0014029F8F|nr:EamA family transporter [Marinobacter sp. JSM 1782161]
MSTTKRGLPVAEGLLLLVAAFWGTSYGLSKQALLFYSVMGFIAIRFLATFLTLLPVFIREYRSGGGRDWRVGLPTGAILFLVFICETYGVAHTSAANAAFLISLCVLFTPFTEWLVFGRRPAGDNFLLAGLSFIGVAMLTTGSDVAFNLGDLLILGAAILRAFMVTVTKKVTAGKQISTLSLTGIQSGVVGFGALAILLAFDPGEVGGLPMTTDFWLIVGYLVLFCTVFAFFAQNYGARNIAPTRVSLLMGTEPAFGALFAVWWLGESIAVSGWLGGGLIIFSALYSILPRTRRSPRAVMAGLNSTTG